MKCIRHNENGFRENLERAIAASSLFDPLVEECAREVIAAVGARGDEALLELTERFDGAHLEADRIVVSQAELFNASVAATLELRRALAFAMRNIADFSRRSLHRSWTARNAQGAKVGERYDPIDRVGVYVPGGTAPLVSTALMTIVLARVAGCPEIVVCTPCNKAGAVDPELLLAARMAGATEMYRVGGAQAIAAMALGTATIRPVRKVFGPGNAYVVAAKRLLFGRVAIDLLPGPSELLVLADATTNPRFIAADMLAQAEHGSGHERVWLVTPSSKLIADVESEIESQLGELERRDLVARALDQNGWFIQVRTIDQGVDIANRIAPEHCEVLTRQAAKIAQKIKTAGAIFLGPWSPTVLGDYVAGPSHTLPTGGAGRSFGGLTADQFQRRTSIVEYNLPALKRSLPEVSAFAALEGLAAHAKSAAIRLETPGLKPPKSTN